MKSRLAAWLLLLTVPLAAVALNVHLLASEPFLRVVYALPGFPAAPGFTDAERLALAVPSTAFIVRPGPPDGLAALRHRGEALYTAQEIEHLVDVRRVVARFTALGLMAVVVLAAAGLAAWRRRGRRATVGRALARGGWLLVGLVACVGLGIALAWPWLFTGFHQVFFPPGTWQFPLQSGLIRLFPDPFWYSTALALAGLCAAEGLAVAWLGRRLAHSS